MQSMDVFDKLRVLIYRYHEKGLEVFLIEPKMKEDQEIWRLPQGSFEKSEDLSPGSNNYIALESTQDNLSTLHSVAVEGDYHDIPSIRGMIKHDIKRVSSKIKDVLPDLERGSFVAVKDVIKKMLPNEYQSIKELKDILLERNAVIY